MQKPEFFGRIQVERWYGQSSFTCHMRSLVFLFLSQAQLLSLFRSIFLPIGIMVIIVFALIVLCVHFVCACIALIYFEVNANVTINNDIKLDLELDWILYKTVVMVQSF